MISDSILSPMDYYSNNRNNAIMPTACRFRIQMSAIRIPISMAVKNSIRSKASTSTTSTPALTPPTSPASCNPTPKPTTITGYPHTPTAAEIL